MNRKIQLQEIANALARKQGITKKSAENFLRQFFDVIASGLREDQLVKVKGFGTFKILTVDERESVNINTGERFSIGSHTKISFTPDAALKQMVNRPFSQFQTIILNEETDEEELKAADRRYEETISRQADESNTNAEETPSLAAEAIAPAVQDEEEVQEKKEPLVEISEEPAISEHPEPESEPAGQQEETVAAEAPMSSLLQQREDAPVAADGETVAEENEQSNISAAAPETAVAETEETGTSEPKDEDTQEPADIAIVSAAAEIHDKDNNVIIEEEMTTEKSNKVWKIAAIVFACLSLLMAGYIAGMHHLFDNRASVPEKEKVEDTNNRQPDSQPVPTEAENEVQPSEDPAEMSAPKAAETPDEMPVPPASDKPQTATPAAKTNTLPLHPNGNVVISGEMGTHTMQPGQSIEQVAQLYYGSKEYAYFIIQHNQLKNPNIVHKGAVLKLPKLVLR